MLTEAERQKLAEKLAGLSYKGARKELRRLDPDANLKFWRNSLKNETHTAYELPNLGVRVILVERHDARPISDKTLQKVKYYYTEARVEEWLSPQ